MKTIYCDEDDTLVICLSDTPIVREVSQGCIRTSGRGRCSSSG